MLISSKLSIETSKEGNPHHDCIPGISTRITAQQSPTSVLVEIHILAISHNVPKANIKAYEIVDSLEFGWRVGVKCP